MLNDRRLGKGPQQYSLTLQPKATFFIIMGFHLYSWGVEKHDWRFVPVAFPSSSTGIERKSRHIPRKDLTRLTHVAGGRCTSSDRISILKCTEDTCVRFQVLNETKNPCPETIGQQTSKHKSLFPDITEHTHFKWMKHWKWKKWHHWKHKEPGQYFSHMWTGRTFFFSF